MKIHNVKQVNRLIKNIFLHKYLQIIIIINLYSLWYHFKTIHTRNTIYFTERNILEKKKNSFILIQSSFRFLNDVKSFKNQVNDVFDLFIRCFFQY
jgi:hypothetical protein